MKLRILVLAAVIAPLALGAQGGTDIYVASFDGAALKVGTPRNVTARAGYDNQPSFTRDGKAILYTSTREDAQADIWRVDVDGTHRERMTVTAPESEYSGTVMPDGLHFSVIRVEKDSTQRLWKFALDGSVQPSLVLTKLRPVGYHVWVGDHTLGAFVLGQPNALVVTDARTERTDTVARGIGRALVRVPGRDAFTFVQVIGDTSWLSEVDVRTKAVRRVTMLPPRSEYHVWTQQGQLITTSGSRLMIQVDGRWDVLVDFAGMGITGLSRLALSPTGDRIAFVAGDTPVR